MKKDIQNAMIKPIAEVNGRQVNALGNDRASDAGKFDRNVATAWVLTKGFTDWSVFTKATKSNALKELEEEALKATSKVKAGKTVVTTKQSDTSEEPGSFLTDLPI